MSVSVVFLLGLKSLAVFWLFFGCFLVVFWLFCWFFDGCLLFCFVFFCFVVVFVWFGFCFFLCELSGSIVKSLWYNVLYLFFGVN